MRHPVYGKVITKVKPGDTVSVAGRNKFDYPVEYVVMVPGCYFIDKEARRIRFNMAGLECFDKKVNLRE